MVWSADGWLRTVDGEGVPIAGSAGARGCRRMRVSCATDSRGLRRARLPLEFQWLRIAVARRVVQSDGAAGSPAAVRPRDDRQPVPSGARRAAAAVTLVQRQSHRSISDRSISSNRPGSSATTTARSFITSTSRTMNVGKHLRVMSCLPDQVQSDAFTDPIAMASGSPRPLAGRGRRRAVAICVSAGGEDDWHWLAQIFDASILSDEATAPGLPNFTGAFVGCVVRISRERGCPPTLITSSMSTGHIRRNPSGRPGKR